MSTSKKKVTQEELRRLMNEQKKKLLTSVKKVESPLARYDNNGVLHCIVCEDIVRSENVWSIHLNTKKHKENLLLKTKRKPVQEPNEVEPVKKLVSKRPLPPPIDVPTKKPKSILKNSIESSKLPDNFFDADSNSKSGVKELNNLVNENKKTDSEDDNLEEQLMNDNDSSSVIPEGFFDDPKLDAKARNVEYKDPIEEEWEQFQKEIKEEENKARQIIADDQEVATTERQIDEIDEQLNNWSRVVCLEKKKENVKTVSIETIKIEDESSGDEVEFDEFLDWRAKKSFK